MSSIILMKEILCTFGNLARGSEDHDEIIEYCSNVADDEDYDWNIDSMLESIGPFLVRLALAWSLSPCLSLSIFHQNQNTSDT